MVGGINDKLCIKVFIEVSKVISHQHYSIHNVVHENEKRN